MRSSVSAPEIKSLTHPAPIQDVPAHAVVISGQISHQSRRRRFGRVRKADQDIRYNIFILIKNRNNYLGSTVSIHGIELKKIKYYISRRVHGIVKNKVLYMATKIMNLKYHHTY